MNEESLERDYLPEPPTPNSKQCPFDWFNTLVILAICSHASMNRTKFN